MPLAFLHDVDMAMPSFDNSHNYCYSSLKIMVPHRSVEVIT
jgi:hypothetical protein